MIGKTAGKCLSLISALRTFGHRRPDGPAGEEWDEAVSALTFHVIKMDEHGSEPVLQMLLEGLRDEWQCYLGEEAALKMGLTTRAVLDA